MHCICGVEWQYDLRIQQTSRPIEAEGDFSIGHKSGRAFARLAGPVERGRLAPVSRAELFGNFAIVKIIADAVLV